MRLPSPYRVIATVVHSIVDEYRRLEPQPAQQARQEMSCTSVHMQTHTDDVRYGWRSGTVERPQMFGFGKQTRGEDG